MVLKNINLNQNQNQKVAKKSKSKSKSKVAKKSKSKSKGKKVKREPNMFIKTLMEVKKHVKKWIFLKMLKMDQL